MTYIIQVISYCLQLVVKTKTGELVDRIDPWAVVVRRPKDVPVFEQIFWNPPHDQVMLQ